MPVLLDSDSSRSASNGAIHIGLINNMPDEALKATERQYLSLLDAASHGMKVRLSLYSLPGVPRSETSLRHMASLYSRVEDMWEGQLDGLIVTGREPLAADLREEPYWDSFTQTLEWARENVHAVVWSCLAAHAAVLHMDGIQRVKRSDKLFGILPCTRLMDHPLMAHAPAKLELPHSRWNGLPLEQLVEAGYSVLTQTSGVEVDTFIKDDKNLFVFFQGHPEYEADTLLREYRRDIGRYFKGETPRYPLLPQGYFDSETVAVMNDLQQKYATTRYDEMPSAIAAALGKITIDNTWRASATGLYESWLRHIRAQKSMVSRQSMRAAAGVVLTAFDVPAEA